MRPNPCPLPGSHDVCVCARRFSVGFCPRSVFSSIFYGCGGGGGEERERRFLFSKTPALIENQIVP